MASTFATPLAASSRLILSLWLNIREVFPKPATPFGETQRGFPFPSRGKRAMPPYRPPHMRNQPPLPRLQLMNRNEAILTQPSQSDTIGRRGGRGTSFFLVFPNRKPVVRFVFPFFPTANLFFWRPPFYFLVDGSDNFVILCVWIINWNHKFRLCLANPLRKFEIQVG